MESLLSYFRRGVNERGSGQIERESARGTVDDDDDKEEETMRKRNRNTEIHDYTPKSSFLATFLPSIVESESIFRFFESEVSSGGNSLGWSSALGFGNLLGWVGGGAEWK